MTNKRKIVLLLAGSLACVAVLVRLGLQRPTPAAHPQRPAVLGTAAVSTLNAPEAVAEPTTVTSPPRSTLREFKYYENSSGIAVATEPLQPREYAEDPSHPIQQAVLFQIDAKKVLAAHESGAGLQFPVFDAGDISVTFDDFENSDGVILAKGSVEDSVADGADGRFSLVISGSMVSAEFTIGSRQFVMYGGPLGQTLAEVAPHLMPEKYD